MTRAVSPQVAYQIGQHFKQNNTEQSASHLLAHALLGAATSYATGNNIATGALSGVTSEKAAPILATYLFGTNDPEKLTQEQKDTITSIITLGTAGIAYGASDGDVGSAVNASEVGKGSVENNNHGWGEFFSSIAKPIDYNMQISCAEQGNYGQCMENSKKI